MDDLRSSKILMGTLKKGMNTETAQAKNPKEYSLAIQRSSFISDCCPIDRMPQTWYQLKGQVESTKGFGKKSTITKGKWKDVCKSYLDEAQQMK
jgi:hypothetical protein